MDVLVTQVIPDPGETVWTGRGTDTETGDRVLFGGDWRPMLELHNALETEPEVVADVPTWSVIRRWSE
jgi:hypothetical protein